MNVAGQFDVGSSQTFSSIKMMFCLGDFFGTQTDEIKKLIDGSLAGIFLYFFYFQRLFLRISCPHIQKLLESFVKRNLVVSFAVTSRIWVNLIISF